ncbi:MAG: FHA domain-containing protein [Actinobacteria bacterium]|nr:FHA domain-containing protein [Actinomycetota bacterium]
MATLTCPGCSAPVKQDDLICFTCGANLPRQHRAEETPPAPTIRQEYPRPAGGTAPAGGRADCPHCGTPILGPGTRNCSGCGRPVQYPSGPISPVVLRLSFPTGNVDVPAGTTLVLGRDPEISLVAAAFADCENVSRRHATVTVSDSGEATIRDEQSTNGTFVNGDRVLPGTDARLADGDHVRLAADVTAQVSLVRLELGPATFSQNGHSGG